jgi:hypothetical protein
MVNLHRNTGFFGTMLGRCHCSLVPMVQSVLYHKPTRNTGFASTIIRRENAYYKIQLMLIEAVAMLLKCTAAANSCMAKFVAVGCG